MSNSYTERALRTKHRVALESLCGRRDRRSIFRGRWLREAGDPAKLLDAHLQGKFVLGSHHGGEPTTRLLALDIDGQSHNKAFDAHGACRAVQSKLAGLGFLPPLVVSSKSATGYHVYVLLADAVPTECARRFLVHLRTQMACEEVDVIYPGGSTGDGSSLALPFCGLTGQSTWVRCGGSRVLHPVSLKPYEPDEQLEALAEWPRSKAQVLIDAAPELEARDDEQTQARTEIGLSEVAVPNFRCDLDVLAEHCLFLMEMTRNAASATYEQWFSLATILKVFPGGAPLYEAFSRLDRRRYRPGEPAKKIRSIRGRPRLCTNLGWHCPRLHECRALGVRSPAGLPAKLRRLER